MIKIKRLQLQDERFQMLMNKIIQTPTDNKAACSINRVFKQLKKHGQDFYTELGKLREIYAQRDEKGVVKLGTDGHGHEVPESWMPDPEKKAEFDEKVVALHEQEVELDTRPMNPNILKDVKLSAYELDLLGDLFTEEAGPGVPSGLHAV